MLTQSRAAPGQHLFFLLTGFTRGAYNSARCVKCMHSRKAGACITPRSGQEHRLTSSFLISLLATWPLAYGQPAEAFSTQEERFAERKAQMKNVEF